MDRQGQSHSIDLLFVLLIFAGFVATAMLLISMETSEYQKIIGRMQDNDLSRVTTAYLTQKVRQGREIDAITTEDFHGIPSLCVRSRIAGRQYETYLYVYEGRLMELMTPEGNIELAARYLTGLITYTGCDHVVFYAKRIPDVRQLLSGHCVFIHR